MWKLMSRFSVGTRIYSGFGFVLALLLVVAWLGYNAATEGEGSLASYSSIAGNARRVTAIEGGVVEMRRNVYVFYDTGREENLERARNKLSELRAAIKTVIGQTADSVRRANLEKIASGLEGYAANLEKAVTMRERRDTLTSKVLDVNGAAARRSLSEIIASATRDNDHEAAAMAGTVQEKLMLARLSANRYLAIPEQKRKQETEERVAAFIKAAPVLVERLDNPERKRLATEALEAARKYDAGFREVAQLILDTESLVNGTLAGTGEEMSKVATATLASQQAALDQSESETFGLLRFLTRLVLTVSGIALAVGLAFAFVVARGITRPVNAMTGAMRELAAGNLETAIPAKDSGDEIGAMAKAVQVFKDNAIRVKRLEEEQEEQKRRAEAERKAAMRQLADTFERSVGGVINTVTSAATELQASSEQMAATATETSAQATTVAGASEQASANVQTVATATEELSGSIREIGVQVQRSKTVSEQAVASAQETTRTISELSTIVDQIGVVVSLINDIADQTNLLALNATIEAARAGDAGKGFAVVASEVKNLANQTAKATGDIAAQITRVQAGTTGAVKAIEAISKVIADMSEISSSIASAVEQQGAATADIARNVEQASAGTREVSSNIGSVGQAANETGAAANQIRSSATELSQQAEILKSEVAKFLDQVRADKADMKLLDWNAEVACGVPSIDRDHHRMVDLLNDAYRAMMSGDGVEAGIRIVRDLGEMITRHFADEEKLMGRIAYPGLAKHRRIHEELLGRFTELKRQFERNQADAGPALFNFVANWLKEHTYTQDRAFAEFARSQGRITEVMAA